MQNQQSPQGSNQGGSHAVGSQSSSKHYPAKKYSLASSAKQTRLHSSRVSNSKSNGPGVNFQNHQQTSLQNYLNILTSLPSNTNDTVANNSIDNLSTLRSSDVNEREKNLLDKVKQYKKENQQLINLLKESELTVSERISASKKETEQILKILNKLWPFLQKLITMEINSNRLDNQTREVFNSLAFLLGKDLNIKQELSSGKSSLSMNDQSVMKKENE